MKQALIETKKNILANNFYIFLATINSIILLSEPFIISCITDNFILIQTILLAISTFIYFVTIFLFIKTMVITKPEYNSFYIKLRICFKAPEFIFELFFIMIGWSFLFYSAGFASIRCLRVFRIFWYAEHVPIINPKIQKIAHLSKVCLGYIIKLSNEFFSSKSKGGLLIICIYFYLTFICSLVFYYETSDLITPQGATCSSIMMCYLTLMRASLYDGNGLDYMQTLFLNNYKALGMFFIVYIVMSAIILLNALIGIFGHAFIGDIKNQQSEQIYKQPPQEIELQIQEKGNHLLEIKNSIIEKIQKLQEQINLLQTEIINL